MLMPEAAVNQDHLVKPGQNDIRAAGKISAMEAEPIPQGVNGPSYDDFRLRVPAGDGLHVATALLWTENIHLGSQ